VGPDPRPLVVVGIEAAAKFGYDRTRSDLQAAITDAESKATPITINQVPQYLSGYYKSSVDKGENRETANYQWNSLFRSYGLHVVYRTGTGNVIEMYSDNAPEEEQPVRPIAAGEEVPADYDPDAVAGEQPAEGAQDGGGRRQFDPMRNDANGDGKLSLEEASERMKPDFEAIGANKDGFADLEEITAWRAKRDAERGRPSAEGTEQPAAEQPGAPPPAEAATPAAEPAATPAAPPAP
jgi:hypothetical protein